jgi:hypothetical protein
MKRGKQNKSAGRVGLQNFLQALTRIALASILFFSAIEARALAASAPSSAGEQVLTTHNHELCVQSGQKDGIPAPKHCVECCCCSLAGNDHSKEIEHSIVIIPNLLEIISVKSISAFNLQNTTSDPVTYILIDKTISARGPPQGIIL